MTAKDIISPFYSDSSYNIEASVDADKHILDTLHLLLDSPDGLLRVMDNDACIGVIDSNSMLHGISHLITNRDDSSIIICECLQQDYSASRLAHASEDADAHLVDLLTSPSEDGKIRITLRVRHTDPSAVVHSLERYGFHVIEAHGYENSKALTVATERLKALQALLSV